MPSLRAVLIGCAIGIALPASASATTLMVQTTADDSGSAGCKAGASAGTYECNTLRDAVSFANIPAMAGADPTIMLGPGEFDLNEGPLLPTVEMTITGAGDQGSSVTTIKQTQVATAIDTDEPLTLNDLVVSGNGSGAVGPGIGIVSYKAGSSIPLTLNGVTVTGNTIRSGDGGSPGLTGGNAEGAAIQDYGTLTLTDSIVTGNHDIAGDGGAGSSGAGPGAGGPAVGVIDTQGLVMSGSIVTGNTATGGNGGATAASGQTGAGGGPVTGAGIYISGTPVALSITSSDITDNQALGGNGSAATGAGVKAGDAGTALGGGLYVGPASSSIPLTITDSTIAGNTAEGGQAGNDMTAGAIGGGNSTYAGGAGLFVTNSFPVAISASTFSDNRSIVQGAGLGPGSEIGYAGSAEGAAIYANEGPEVKIVNSTIFGNSAQSGAGSGTTGDFGSFGGGIDAYGNGATAVALYSDTIAGNAATSTLGAAAEYGANILQVTAPVTLHATAVADPLPGGATDCARQDSAAITDDGHNLADDDSCELSTVDGDQLVAGAGLPTSLGANGGPSISASGSRPAIPELLTLAPSATSALIGNGGTCTNPLAAGASAPPFPALTTDERGQPRRATCDIGAFETQPPTVYGTPVIEGTPIVGSDLTCDGFSAAGDGPFTSTGAIGPIAFTFSFSSNGKTVGNSGGYTVSNTDDGHAITCTATATGAYGSDSETSASVQVPAAVTLTSVTETHAKWAEKRSRHGPPVGTSFSYKLNASAKVTLTFARQTTGRRVRGKCVAATRANKRKPSCKLAVTAGKLTGPGVTGSNKLAFAGKLAGRTLPAGSYTVTITASTPSSRASHTLRFTIAR